MFCRISEDSLNPDALPARLRALPAFAPPPGGWARLQSHRQAQRRRVTMISGGFALAASVLVAVGLVGLRPDTASMPEANGVPAATPQVAQLIRRSQALERELSSARPQVAVWTSGRAENAAVLERRLRMIDAQLNFAEGSGSAEQLWRERVRTMNRLVDLHDPQEPALQYASYQY